MPQPLTPFLHDLVGQVAAPTQVWSDRDGQVHPRTDDLAGVVGLLHGDVRLLSGIEAAVDHDPGVPVARGSREDDGVVFTSLLRRLDAAHARTGDPHVRLDRVRRVGPGGLSEDLVVGSALDVEVDVVVEVRLTPDATPMESVRVGGPRVPAEHLRITDDSASWSGAGVEVTVSAPGAELGAEADQVALRWTVTLPAHGSVTVGWTADVVDPAPVVVAAPPDLVAGRVLLDGDVDQRLGAWLDRSVADLSSLAMALPDSPGDVFYAAGAPWYLTLFGRDSLWAARLTLPLGLDVARGTLRTLARLQGRRRTRGPASSRARSRTSCGNAYELNGCRCRP